MRDVALRLAVTAIDRLVKYYVGTQLHDWELIKSKLEFLEGYVQTNADLGDALMACEKEKEEMRVAMEIMTGVIETQGQAIAKQV